MTSSYERDQRDRPRQEIRETIDVNGGVPFRGGRLKDISCSGAAVIYPAGAEPLGSDINIDDEIVLDIRGRSKLSGNVVRKFEGGFAIRFEWSDDIIAVTKK